MTKAALTINQQAVDRLGEAFDLWNHEAFDLLYQLYHLTVTDISQIPTLPIAISK